MVRRDRDEAKNDRDIHRHTKEENTRSMRAQKKKKNLPETKAEDKICTQAVRLLNTRSRELMD